MIHAFPLFHEQVAAAGRAITRAGEFIRSVQVGAGGR
jgi:hypothetical protein